MLLVPLLSGCHNALIATEDGIYANEMQFIQSEKEFKVKTPHMDMEAKASSKVDSEAIKALGEQIRGLVEELRKLKPGVP